MPLLPRWANRVVSHRSDAPTKLLIYRSARTGVQAGRGRPKSWRQLSGHNQLQKVIEGVRLTDGIEAVSQDAQAAAA